MGKEFKKLTNLPCQGWVFLFFGNRQIAILAHRNIVWQLVDIVFLIWKMPFQLLARL